MKFTKRHNPFPIIGPYAGIYAHGVEVMPTNHTLYVSGQVGQDQHGEIAQGFEAQTRQALKNVFHVLKQANMVRNDIVKMNFYLTNPEDMNDLVKIRKELLDGVSPAITTLFIDRLVHPDWLIEVEVVAAKSPQ